jgi:hypothetical protein
MTDLPERWPTREPRPHKYQTLLNWLEALPEDQPSARLSFAELEHILSAPLAANARVATGYWAGSATAQRNWLRVGFSARLNPRDGGSVTFTRLQEGAQTKQPRRYAPLIAWLQALPADQDKAELTLSELEQLIGQPLTSSAGTPGYWTTVDRTRTSWRSAGFSARLNHATRVVTFTRLQP